MYTYIYIYTVYIYMYIIPMPIYIYLLLMIHGEVIFRSFQFTHCKASDKHEPGTSGRLFQNAGSSICRGLVGEQLES